jgi:hypothetical protein
MAIFLSGRVLLRRESIARESAFQRAVPHGDLTGMTARDVRSGAAQALRRRQRAALDQQLFSAFHRFPHPHVGVS